MSAGILQNGTNVFAAQVHLHPYSLTKVEFHVVAHLIGNTRMRPVTPFPVVRSSRDYLHANSIVNNNRDYHYFWSGYRNSSILTMAPFSGRSYVNQVKITRSTDCIPDSVEIWGIFGDYEEDSTFVYRKTLLLQNRQLVWRRPTIELTINSRLAGYRGYEVRFNRAMTSADCVQVRSIDFSVSKQVTCVLGSNVINIGDSLRSACPAGSVGVVTRECLQTGSGSSWGESIHYCCMSLAV